MKIAGWILVGWLVCTLTLGCALYRNDHCYVPNEQYVKAREMFVQTGSLDLVERQLKDLEWRPCKINEVLYRLSKEFEVLPEELPSQQAQ